ncbi:Growth hormone secretagogue receptor type 1 [Clonorchis sinensis]|uniref:Growth hormone secretagogue receptor type 1 n=1 Tax=Clonorchis sinensis TaxID=79923 RepID=A0A419PR70_CLOSI|nr:Growth hormone secretagogue receptor type 1 [Clonorchis sinensis]
MRSANDSHLVSNGLEMCMNVKSSCTIQNMLVCNQYDCTIRNLTIHNISDNVTEKIQQPVAVHIVMKVAFAIQMMIFVFGLFGNALTIVVLRTKRLRQSSTTVYLTALAVVDLLYIISSMLVNIFNTTVFFPSNIRNHSSLICPLTSFVHYTLTYLSVWLMVAVTVERAIWVGRPFRAKHICTQRNAIITILSLTIGLIALDSHFFFTMTYSISTDRAGEFECTPNYFAQSVFPYIDMLLICFLPIIFMTGANVVIGMGLKKMREFNRKRKAQNATSVQESNCPSFIPSLATHEDKTRKSPAIIPPSNKCTVDTKRYLKIYSRKARSEMRDSIKVRTCVEKSSSLTKMLVAISIFFIVSVSPLMAYDLVYFALDVNKWIEKEEPDRVSLVFAIEKTVYTLWYTNFAVHFVIYCLNGPPFRAKALQLFQTVCCCSHHDLIQNAAEGKTEYAEPNATRLVRNIAKTECTNEPKRTHRHQFDQTPETNGCSPSVSPASHDRTEVNPAQRETIRHVSHVINEIDLMELTTEPRSHLSHI